MERILIPVDGSNESKKAAAQALSIADKYGASVTFLSVLDRDDMLKATKEDAEKMMDIMIEALDCTGVMTDKKTSFGAAPEEIVRTAREGSYDHIFMGHRSINVFRYPTLGSVARAVTETAFCPVTIVK